MDEAASEAVCLDDLSDLQLTWLKLTGECDCIASIYDDVIRLEEVTTDGGSTRWQVTGDASDVQEFRNQLLPCVSNFVSESVQFTDPRVSSLLGNPAVQQMLQNKALLSSLIDFQKRNGSSALLLCELEANSLLVYGRFVADGQLRSALDHFVRTFGEIVDHVSVPVDKKMTALLRSRKWREFLTKFPASAELCAQVSNQEPPIVYLAALCNANANGNLKTKLNNFLTEHQLVKDKFVPCTLPFMFAVNTTELLKNQFQQLELSTSKSAALPVTINTELKVGAARAMGVYFNGCLCDYHIFKKNLDAMYIAHRDFNLSNGCFNFADKLAVIRYLFNDTSVQNFLSQCEQQNCLAMYYVKINGKLNEYSLLRPPVAKPRIKVALQGVFTMLVHSRGAASKCVTVQTFIDSKDAINYDETVHMNSDLCVELGNHSNLNAAGVKLPETSTPLVQLGVVSVRHGYLKVSTDGKLVAQVKTVATYCDENDVSTLNLLVRQGFTSGSCNLIDILCECCNFEQLNVLCTTSKIASDIVNHLQQATRRRSGTVTLQTTSAYSLRASSTSASFSATNSLMSNANPLLRSAPVLLGHQSASAFSTTTVNGVAIDYLLGDLAVESSDVIVVVAYVGFGRGGNCQPRGILMQSLFTATGKQFTLQDFQPFASNGANATLTEMRVGDVWQSAAGTLKCRKLVLIALPNSSDASFGKFFNQAMFNVLNGCVSARFGSVSLPLVGTGTLGLSANNAASYMMDVLDQFKPRIAASRNTTVLTVRIIGYSGNRSGAYEYENTMRQYSQLMSPLSISSGNLKVRPKSFTNGASSSGQSSSQSTAERYQVNGVILRAVLRQITDAAVDAIVNSTGEDLDMSGGLSKALLAAGNPGLQAAVKQVGRMRTDKGYPYVTTSGTFGTLKCKHVIHVKFPRTVAECRQAMTAVVKEADRLQCRRVAIPSIGTGGGKLPGDQVADALASQLVQELNAGRPKHLIKFYFLATSAGTLSNFKTAIKRLCSPLPVPNSGFNPFASFFAFPVASPTAVPSAAPPRQKNKIELKLSLVALQKAELYACCNDLQTLVQTNLYSKEFKMDSAIKSVPNGTLNRLEGIHCVTIHVDLSKETQVPVRINGRKECTLTCYTELLEIVVETKSLDHAKTMQRQAQWEYNVGNGRNEFVAYDIFANKKLEEEYVAQKTEVEFPKWCNDSVQRVKVDFQNMIEVQLTTGNATTSVRRLAREERVISVLPAEWNVPIGSRPTLRVPLASNDPKYVQIAQDFVGAAVTVISIERIQNETLYEQFVAQKKSFEKRFTGQPQLVKRELYHGTPAGNVSSIVQHGLDSRYCGKTAGVAYGQGAYFSNKLSTSLGYAQADSTGSRFVFVCDVLIGSLVVGNSSMRVLPFVSTNSIERYDTAVDNLQNPTIFVKFHDAQVYPLYLVRFK